MLNKKLLLVVNPKSGTERMKFELLPVVQIFSKAGYGVTVYPTTARRDATKYVASLEENYDLIVCCGGDGTLNEVISGIMLSGKNIPVAYIPAGTLNEWSSGLGISRNIKTAASDITEGRILPLDIGRFNKKYFTYTASFGAFTSASYSAPQDVKNVLGQAAYFFEGIKSIGNIKPVELTFNVDGKEFSGNYLFGAVTNSLSVGGIIKLDPATVEFNDGFFELMLIENPENLAELNDTIDGVLKHDFNRKRIIQMRAKKVVVTGGKNVDWTLDGEKAAGSDTLEIENVNKAINFLIPNKQ